MTASTQIYPHINNSDSKNDFSSASASSLVKPVRQIGGFFFWTVYLFGLVLALALTCYNYFMGERLYDAVYKLISKGSESKDFNMILGFACWVFRLFDKFHDKSWTHFVVCFSYFIEICFYSVVLLYPEYSSSNHKFIKSFPLLLSAFLFGSWGFAEDLMVGFWVLLLTLVGFVFKYFTFIVDNESGSVLVKFKPWIFIIKSEDDDEEEAFENSKDKK